jgi:hypothetical protein
MDGTLGDQTSDTNHLVTCKTVLIRMKQCVEHIELEHCDVTSIVSADKSVN